jgi:alkylation response protein AidB-like acyl-CoA dehydrogenase
LLPLKTIDAGRLALAADSPGAAQTMLDKSIAYANPEVNP